MEGNFLGECDICHKEVPETELSVVGTSQKCQSCIAKRSGPYGHLEIPEVHFTNFEKWQSAVKAVDCRVKKVTVSKTNVYYQAIHKVYGVVGFFNTGEGAK